jgi:hypothetical protein
MTLRTPYDGAPFYCVTCGAGFYEFVRCDRADCDREDITAAKRRQSSIFADSTKSVPASSPATDSDAVDPRSPSFPQDRE